jgi:hypothetical protein
VRGHGAHYVVNLLPELVTGLRRGDWHGDDDPVRPAQAERGNGRAHRGAGGDPVVDHERGAIGHRDARPPRTEPLDAPVELELIVEVS